MIRRMGWPIFLIYIVLPIVALPLLGLPIYFRVKGDLDICRLYYPEMSRMACYFSSKAVRVPGGR